LPCPLAKKQKANTHPVISQKLSYEKSEQELKDAVQKEVKDFFEGAKQARRARENPEPSYFFLPPDQLRKKLEQKNGILLRAPRNNRYRTMTALSPSHMRRRKKRRE
jgi:hypothetical protein